MPLLFILLAMLVLPVQASTTVNEILNADTAPPGVVFEVVEGDEAALNSILPQIRTSIDNIRKKWPKTLFAVVSHGQEQFGLLSKNSKANASAHQQVQSLLAQGVPVAVCGTHASWYNYTSKDYPDYVDVVPAGPGKIREYQRRGFLLVEIQ